MKVNIFGMEHQDSKTLKKNNTEKSIEDKNQKN